MENENSLEKPNNNYFIGFLKFIFIFLVFIGIFIIKNSIPLPEEKNYIKYLYFLAGIMIPSTIYIIYYFISEGHIKDIVIGLIISIVLTFLSTLFPLFAIVALLYFLYSIIRSIVGAVKLLPMVLLSSIFYSLLFNDFVLLKCLKFESIPTSLNISNLLMLINGDSNINDIYNTFISRSYNTYCEIAYFILTFLISIKYVSKTPMKQTLFNISFLIIIIPVFILLIYSLKKSIDTLFETKYYTETTKDKTFMKQEVKGYTTASGKRISSYTRSIPKTTIETTLLKNTTLGIGGTVSVGLKQVSKKLDESSQVINNNEEEV